MLGPGVRGHYARQENSQNVENDFEIYFLIFIFCRENMQRREKHQNARQKVQMSSKNSEYQEKKSSIHLKYNLDNKRDISRLK